MKKKNKDTVWITSGVFSSHYLLERLPKIVHKLYGLTDEEIGIMEGNVN
ncbi:MAG: hypothetical protein Q8M71_02785 [Thermodesulfovibrionales bacterium]|nr:hypothetical protein [Thermodesulfovibrionales bacterium]